MIEVPVGYRQAKALSMRAPVLVLTGGLKCNVLVEDQLRGDLLGSLAVGLAFRRTVDAVEPDAFSSLGVQDVDGVAVKN